MRRFVPIVTAVLALALPGGLPAQTPPLGSEFQANAITNGVQRDPRIAALGAGFVVVWTDYNGDGSGVRVAGQVFDGTGEKVGGEFQANTYTTGGQRDPAVASDGANRFVVVWESMITDQDGDKSGVFGQRFDASGAKVGPEFQANTYTTGYQFQPEVGMNEKGEFVVVWNDFGRDLSSFGMFGQKFDAAGAKAGPEFQANTNTLGPQHQAAVGVDRAGRFVVAWSSTDLYGDGVFAQRFTSAAAKVGPEFRVHTSFFDDQNEPALAMQPAGDFLVVWTTNPSGAAHHDISGQRFNLSGEKVGGEFLVTSANAGYQLGASAAVDRAGRFVVAWDDFPDDRSSYGVTGRLFDRRAQPLGNAFAFSLTSRADISAAAAPATGPVAVWMHGDGSGDGISGRRQRLTPVALHVDEQSRAGTSSDANGVLEPDETVFVEPIWVNASSAFAALDGQLPLVFCPIGAACVAPADRDASYGSLPPNSIAGCDDGSDAACYRVFANGLRPGTHWDGDLSEGVFGSSGQSWRFHVGDSFSDVPRGQPFYRKIETLLHHGVTSGCGGTQYCPGAPVPRDQMAIFVGKAMAGAGDLVPRDGLVGGEPYSCQSGGASVFADVSPTNVACRHVHYIASQNVTLGCSPTQYCPNATVTRDAMASFIAKALAAPGGGGAVPLSYGPDPGTGRSYSCAPGAPNVHFSDVPPSNAFCKHIHYLWARGIVDGCSATKYCPAQAVNRDAMAKFIANAFGLELYGP